MTTLAKLITEQLGDGGKLVEGGYASYAEVADTSTGKVWMTLTPATQADLDSLDLPDGYVRVGSAQSSMDQAGFRHAPMDANSPVPVREIAGRMFINVAVPETPEMPAEEGGPIHVMVNKGHVIGFEAGREIVIMETATGSFIELVGTPDIDDSLFLPEGASLRRVTLDAPLVITLPTPTETYFWFRPDGVRSFQGPCDLPA